MLLVSLLLIGLFISKGLSITCTVESSCKAKCNDTISLDISQLFSYPYKIDLKSSLHSPGEYFLYNPCSGTKCAPSDDFLSSVCLAITDTELSSCGQPGVDFITWELLGTDPYHFKITYEGGDCQGTDCQHSIFVFKESTDTDTSESDIEYVNYNSYYNFQVNGKCIGQTTDGCTVNNSNNKKNVPDGIIGIVLIILAVIGLVTYFIVGVIVMKFYKGAQGVELIPNYEFWSQLPLLIRDGCLFTISPCYKRNSDYQNLK